MAQPTDLRYITWNLNVMGASEDRVGRELDFLASQLGDGPAVVALQEAAPTAYDVLVRSRLFEWHEYSLVRRPPGPFDRGNRRLGCVLAGNAPAMLRNTAVLGRTPFPDRTLMAEIELEGSRFVAVSYHSLTGVGYNLTKGAAFRAE